ncbi:hypothetical protein C8R47DRAFT_803220 [Mycena vitilis]|nr:hypothetical protein C8R47DRAFT_803220 [Mycena vitilis]
MYCAHEVLSVRFISHSARHAGRDLDLLFASHIECPNQARTQSPYPPTAMALSLLAAELFSIFVACALYGIYIVTVGMAARVLLRTRSGRPGSRLLVGAVTLILFVNQTLDLGVGMDMLVRAFVPHNGPEGAERVFRDTSSWQAFAKSFSVALQTLTGDALLIYRCWYIWSKSWRIIGLPVLLWLGSFSCQMAMLALLHTLGEEPVNSGRLLPWGLAFWILTICTNVIATSLIVWRIWGVEKQGREFRSAPDGSSTDSTLNNAMRRIIESGMIYTVASLLEAIAYATQSYLNYPGSSLVCYSIGINLNLIIIRGSANQSAEGTQIHFPHDSVELQFAGTQSMGPPHSMTSNDRGKTEVFILSAHTHGKDPKQVQEPPDNEAQTSDQSWDYR